MLAKSIVVWALLVATLIMVGVRVHGLSEMVQHVTLAELTLWITSCSKYPIFFIIEVVFSTAIETDKFRRIKLTVRVVICPVFDREGLALLKRSFVEKKECTTKVGKTLDWSKENNYTNTGDFMGIDDKTFPIKSTNMKYPWP